MLTESKTEILVKIGATLSKVYTGVSTIDGVAAIEVDTDKIGVPIATILKTEVDEDKIVEKTKVLTECPRASLVEEVIVSSVDEVLGTSTVDTRSWEVLGVDWVENATVVLTILPVEADSTDVTVFGGV